MVYFLTQQTWPQHSPHQTLHSPIILEKKPQMYFWHFCRVNVYYKFVCGGWYKYKRMLQKELQPWALG